MINQYDALKTGHEQAQNREKCAFPAIELREYRDFLAKKATYAEAHDLESRHLLEEIKLIQDLQRRHAEDFDCFCWFTREELEAQLRLCREVR